MMDLDLESSSYWAVGNNKAEEDDDLVVLGEKSSEPQLEIAEDAKEINMDGGKDTSKSETIKMNMIMGSEKNDDIEGRSVSSSLTKAAGDDLVEDNDILLHKETKEWPNDIEPTRGTDNIIKPIDTKVVHQICSGQVIVTLSTAIKELVENAIDAGATNVDIRLVEFGSELIEVSDNGSGVNEENLQGLAMKHHTSKISEFEDLSSVGTFGFRGEALSSLCALSSLSVISRCRSSGSKSAFRIEYDCRGKIISKTPSAREYGTTVYLKNIFTPLPVRHREFMKNLKREFHKAVNVLYGYCLIAQGVRITCTNQVGNGGASKVISVPASQTMKERIVSLFGSKQIKFLMQFEQKEELNEEILGEFGLSDKTFLKDKYKLDGYISKPHHGRTSNDRQFFFVNSRPCDPAKVSRIVNEVFHGYSRHQSPFVCLNIRTKQENVDVNVTPDKRVLYLQSEKSLYALLKASLTSMYTSESSSFNLSSGQEMLSFSQSQSSESQSDSQSQSVSINEDEDLGNYSKFARQFSTNHSSSFSKSGTFCKTSSAKSTSARSFLQTFAHKTNTISSKGGNSEKEAKFTVKRALDPSPGNCSKQPKLFNFISTNGGKFSNRRDEEDTSEEDEEDFELKKDSQDSLGRSSRNGSRSSDQEEDENCRVVYDDELEPEGHLIKDRPQVHTKVNWDEVKEAVLTRKGKSEEKEEKNYARKFRAKISPENNESAEQELKMQLTKEMFQKMKIIGQFNLGFILVNFGADLFIVDQHASDEKYNFEDLEKNTVMQTQRLICPMELQLPAVSENIIMDNLEVFQKNGFDFQINPEGEPTSRIKLIKIPYSKSCEFGKSDVDELIFMMEDASEKSFVRPSKVRMMLASRACRKSVMIGSALSLNEMKGIVSHMGEMDQPWNCPHGRPTIRHLMNINLLPDLHLHQFNH